MDAPTVTALRIGDWSVDAATYQISRDGQDVRLEARTMRLLLCLAENPGETVSTDTLMDRVWSGTVVTQDSVYQAVASLRRLLGDDPKNPTYIATVPRRGYRMVATVSTQHEPPAPIVLPSRAFNRKAAIYSGLLALLALALGLTYATSVTRRHEQSIAVLPFLDLTSNAMTEEYFADGMTEELIDRLSKVPGLQVPSPTASFFFKDKRLPVSEIAAALNVTYVVDGSVRKSGDTLRIAARLIRAENGFIVWAGAYDRASGNLLQVQDEIAGHVAQALTAARESK